MQLISTFFFLCLLPILIFGKEYKGAEYRTKEAYKYGRFEVSYKAPAKEGALASFFTYFTGNDTVKWSSLKWNEIDIEILGRYNNNVQFNTITPGQINHVRSNFVNFDPSADFNTYAFEWTPDYVSWFINGIEAHKQTGPHITSLEYAQKIMMNIWNPQWDNWVGTFDPLALPAFAFYDWVKYYSYTPNSGNYGTNNNFTELWVDNFDSFDENRWEKATHTFFGNNCDFIPENAVFSDGKLVLCLTDKTNLGFVDNTTPTILSLRALKNSIEVYFSEELDKTSAEKKSNYTIVGVTIESAELMADQKTVKLVVSELDSTKSYNLIVLNIKDVAIPQNNMSGKVISFSVSTPLKFPIKINVGSGESSGFLSDQEWELNREFGYTEGQPTEYPETLPINLTNLDPIYRSERYGLVSYRIRVPNGKYNLNLMFAEKFHNITGKRIFDVFIEDIFVKDNFDVIINVAKNSAFDLTVNDLEITDGIIDINFSAELELAILSGITVESIPTSIKNELDSDRFLNYELKQNYPNPFNGITTINYVLPKSTNVELKIYDILGSQIFFKQLGIQNAGDKNYVWTGTKNDGSIINSGVYIYQISAENFTQSRKMIFLK